MDKPIQQQPIDAIRYGHWGRENAEDLVCVRVNHETVEIHCHGGIAAVQRIINDLKTTGALVRTPESTDANTACSFAAEFQFCLLQATTQRTAHEVLRQSQLFPRELQKLNTAETTERKQNIQAMLNWSEFGLHLTAPWKVVLCGLPNVGKSSLINSLVGFSRSVVFDQPGTTRDVVTVQTALEGWPIEFSDTAGLRETNEDIESAGIAKAKATIDNADLLLIVVDARVGAAEAETELATRNPRSLMVYNKIDLVDDSINHENAICVSATTQSGLAQLAKKIVSILVPEVPSKKQAYPITARQISILNSIEL